MNSIRRNLPRAALIVLAGAAMYRLTRIGLSGGSDFAVFWRAAQALRAGIDPYTSPTPERGFIFKYPPWALALFWPLAWTSLTSGKSLWILLELLSVAYCIRWLISVGVSVRIALGTCALYWYLWFEHFMYGQVMIPLLALCLWAIHSKRRERAIPAAFLELGLSLKVFSMIAVFGAGKRALARATLLALATALALSHLLLLLFIPLHAIPELYRHWIASASSGAAELGPEVIRGAFNHGLPAAILRQLDPGALHPGWDVPTSLGIAALLAFAWWKFSQRLRTEERFSGWLALAVVAHPLAWQHSFTWIFPLSALAIQSAQERRDRVALALALVGTVFVALWVPQVVLSWAKPVELYGSKSWGAALCALSLCLKTREGARSENAESPRPT